jgi:2-aminoadipate transaminase
MNTTSPLFAERMNNIPESFIREILKVATMPEIISFAGGLPNPAFFPAEKIAIAAEKVIRMEGKTVLQYAPTEGYLPLRDYIAQRQSAKEGIAISPEQLIILNGSQQGLDLSGKLFCNKGQNILMEEPSYLGAIQAFSAYEPTFHSIDISGGAPEIAAFNNITRKVSPAFFYCIPNFQNPTGNWYSQEQRISLVESQFHSPMLWIEDNPYGEICFDGNGHDDFHSLIPEKTLYLGSFSKIISPGMRLGWATGPLDIIKKMTIAKQASDLHSNNLAQRVIYQFLYDNNLDDHLQSIRKFYAKQASMMVKLLKQHFPSTATWIEPRGGMFLWVILPPHLHASFFLKEAMKENVLFVPGENFFHDRSRGLNTLRLNFSNPSETEMAKGIEKLGQILRRMEGDGK